jgi:hypothetical protein
LAAMFWIVVLRTVGTFKGAASTRGCLLFIVRLLSNLTRILIHPLIHKSQQDS